MENRGERRRGFELFVNARRFCKPYECLPRSRGAHIAAVSAQTCTQRRVKDRPSPIARPVSQKRKHVLDASDLLKDVFARSHKNRIESPIAHLNLHSQNDVNRARAIRDEN